MKSYVKNEAVALVNAIYDSDIKLHTEDDDHIWDEIVAKCEAAEFERSHYIDDEPQTSDEAPFILGDAPNQLAGLPDIIYEGESFVLGIEHFQFDASNSTRKGSRMMQAEAKADGEMSRLIHSSTERPLHIEVPVKADFTYEMYVKSLLASFKKHANNIPKYLTSLSQKYPDKKIMLAFYIEDETAIGNYIRTSRGSEAMCPLCVKEFLDELSLHPELSYIIARIQDSYTYTLHIQLINSDFIRSLYREAYNMDTDEYWSYQYKKTSNIYH